MSNPESHDYIEKCPYCGKYMTWKQIQHHKCIKASPCFSVKEIPVLYCCETQDENGKVFIAHGLDGTMYRLVEKNPADEKKHLFRTDEEGTESLCLLFFNFRFIGCASVLTAAIQDLMRSDLRKGNDRLESSFGYRRRNGR